MDLLLLSNSVLPGSGYLEYALPLLKTQFGGRRKVVFIPFAGVTQSWDAYTDKVRLALAELDLSITGVHTVDDAPAAIAAADVVMVGGGNTFHLLKQCRERGLLDPIRQAVKNGALYVGWSAGANLACPTIRTTNDMPIIDPGGLDALNLVPLQINPHFTNALPAGHQGETREQRIRELLVVAPELNVIGLPEGGWITVQNGHAQLGGDRPALLFKANEEAITLAAGYRFF
ncbi:dipeptidase E [Kosakonia oryzendophytica]|uniref:Peptidase E n=1 Tax=Kosakonia oryzendophytica TaxID=1005665 RepID=A0A1C3ZPQ1_9ENTR|nr:dipeptidase PepE [Kosakonia oryzendophytica]TDT52636.1 dipeptidase E [Enterobacter sp. AG5470]WBT57925.1 dipeptidase PepE [Kosakonia oryzendophytica]SCB84417.1 dipeptidase E [Kosakonia oryzendophytica]